MTITTRKEMKMLTETTTNQVLRDTYPELRALLGYSLLDITYTLDELKIAFERCAVKTDRELFADIGSARLNWAEPLDEARTAWAADPSELSWH